MIRKKLDPVTSAEAGCNLMVSCPGIPIARSAVA